MASFLHGELNKKQKSLKQEKQLSSDIGAKLTPASGAFFFAKGDMQTEDFLIESKATDKESISLKRQWLEKIELEALQEGKTPLLILEIKGRRYYVFRGSDITLQ